MADATTFLFLCTVFRYFRNYFLHSEFFDSTGLGLFGEDLIARIPREILGSNLVTGGGNASICSFPHYFAYFSEDFKRKNRNI
jgi:hypothetical protein